jgi:hypothetical protein
VNSDGVNDPISPIRIVLNHLEHSGAPKTLQRFDCVVPLSDLGKMECVSEEFPHRNWKRHQIFLAAPDPD